MASQVEIANSALIKIGAAPIMSFDDDVKTAKAIKNSFTQCRRAVLRSHVWKCATARTILSPVVTPPVFGYTYVFNLPSDCLRIIDLEDDPEYRVEGRQILSDSGTINLRYIKDVGEDVTVLDDLCAEAFASYLGWTLSYQITQDGDVKTQLWKDYQNSLRLAKSIDAKDMPWAQMEANEFVDSRISYPGLDRSNR